MRSTKKKSKTLLVIVLVLIVDVCIVAFVIGSQNNLILRVHNDSLAPTINEGDVILCKPINDSDQLRIGDIISYRKRSLDEHVEIGQIQAIYDVGNGQFAYEVKDDFYTVIGLTTIVQHGEVEGQFIGVIYNNTIGIVILLVGVLVIGILFIRRRHNKKAYATVQRNDAESPQAFSQVGTPDNADIIRYKELLDMGAITPEEFEAKKKELLGL